MLLKMSNINLFIENFWYSNEFGNNSPKELLQQISDKICTNMFIGYNELGNRCLFLKTDTSSIPQLQDEKTNISLRISKSNQLIYIELNDLYFGEIFNDLIVSIFNKLKNISESENMSHFIALFKKWNELFKAKIQKYHLSEKELLGLLGELYYLKNRINEAEDHISVNLFLEAWSGPDGKANDFIFEDINIEVKTIESQKEYVNISSEYQLSSTERPINLIIFKTIRSTAGFSLVDIVGEIREIINQKLGDTEKFLFKLNNFNLDFKNTTYYKDLKIKISDPSIYNVELDGFPKITTSNLIDGVFGVQYKIYLNDLIPFKI